MSTTSGAIPAVTSLAVRGGTAGDGGRVRLAIGREDLPEGDPERGVNGLEDSPCIMEPGDLDDLLFLRRRRFVRRSGASPGLAGTLTGVADRLRGIAHSADSRRRPLASFAPAVRPHAAPIARQGSQASVLAMGSRSRHREGRAQLEGLQPLLARDLPMIEPRMGGEPQLRRTLPGSPINRPKCHGPTKAENQKVGP